MRSGYWFAYSRPCSPSAAWNEIFSFSWQLCYIQRIKGEIEEVAGVGRGVAVKERFLGPRPRGLRMTDYGDNQEPADWRLTPNT
jgi:hypothetical protein